MISRIVKMNMILDYQDLGCLFSGGRTEHPLYRRAEASASVVTLYPSY